MRKKPKLKKRPKNICICGKKMKKYIEDCVFCGGSEYYQCDDSKCYKMYDLNGQEL